MFKILFTYVVCLLVNYNSYASAAAGGAGAAAGAGVAAGKSLEDYEIVSRRRYASFPTIEGIDLTADHDAAVEEITEIKTAFRTRIPPSSRNAAKAWVTVIYDEGGTLKPKSSKPTLFLSGLAGSPSFKTEDSGRTFYHINSSIHVNEFMNEIFNFITIPENFDIFGSSIYCREKYLEGKSEAVRTLFRIPGVWLAKCLLETYKRDRMKLPTVQALCRRMKLSSVQQSDLQNTKFDEGLMVEEFFGFFAHSEQAALIFFIKNGIISKICHGIPPAKIKAMAINIVTQRDMCENCFRTVYINPLHSSSSFPTYIFVTGTEEHDYQRPVDGSVVSSRDSSLKLTHISGSTTVSTLEDKLFVRILET